MQGFSSRIKLKQKFQEENCHTSVNGIALKRYMTTLKIDRTSHENTE